jgi:hypothetical protein
MVVPFRITDWSMRSARLSKGALITARAAFLSVAAILFVCVVALLWIGRQVWRAIRARD